MTFRCTLALACVLLATTAGAQQQTGALEGRVTDTSGAVLPGATVTLTGAALLGGVQNTVTGEQGTYRLSNIPVGTYVLTFELSGFAKKTYQDIRIQAGTTFTVNVLLEVGGLEAEVTVLGESPILETAQASASFTFTKELMSTVPNPRDVWGIITQTPGVSANAINVGGTQTGNQVSFRGHGVDPRQNTYVLDGANITDSQNNGASQFYLDVEAFEEMQLQVSSHSAEVQTPGMVVNIVPKSGSNRLRGGGSAYFTNESLQNDNVDDDLQARGVNRASNLNEYFDVGFDLGGPILRDRLWFYGSYRWQEIENFITGTTNPDGSFPIDRTVLWFPSIKINWQVASNQQLSGFYQTQEKKRYKRGLSALRPVETTQDQRAKPLSALWSFRYDWTPSSNFMLGVRSNWVDGGFELVAQPGVDTNVTPASQDTATGLWSNAPPNEFGVEEERRAVGATATYYADSWGAGKHEIKAGFDIRQENYFGNRGSAALTTYPADHRLLFFNGAPLEVILFQSGAQNISNPSRSAFAEDSWQIGRVRLNIGGRWDWQTNRLRESTAPQSRFFTDSVTQPGTGNLAVWNTFAPRLSVVFDVTGESKTLVKGSYNRYYWQMWIDKGRDASRAGDRQHRYTWNDLNGDRQFTTNELGVLRSVTDPSTSPVTIDSDLDATKTDEFTVGVTRELASNLSLAATYRHRQDDNLSWLINPNVTAADYTGRTGRDPGPDGALGTADDGSPLDFYSIDPAKRTLSPNFITTWDGFTQEYDGFELTLYRRFADNWQFVGSYTAGAQRENLAAGTLNQLPSGGTGARTGLPTPQDANQTDGTVISQSKPHIVKFMGSYMLPKNVTVSGYYTYTSGDRFTRLVNSAGAGVGTLTQGNIVVLATERSTNHYDGLHLLDARLAYDIVLGGRGRLQLALDLFNLLNVNTVTSQNLTSGTAYGRVLDFVPPRIARFGARVTF
jgi:hypothetical protein